MFYPDFKLDESRGSEVEPKVDDELGSLESTKDEWRKTIQESPFFKKISLETTTECFDNAFTELVIIRPLAPQEVGQDCAFALSMRIPPYTIHQPFELMPWAKLEKMIEQLKAFYKDKILKRTSELQKDLDSFDDKLIAANTESSMKKTTEGQTQQLETLYKKYSEQYEKIGGHGYIIKQIKEFLAEKYLKNPIMFKETVLPLEFDSKLNTEEVRVLYYLNPYHTAWRYFLDFNQWIDPRAQYADTFDGDAIAAPIGTKDRIDIAYIWLAICDKSKLAEGETIESRQEQFFHEIAYIARAHNWDDLDRLRDREKAKTIQSMIKTYGRIVDDLEPDAPSCLAGVRQRLLQIIQGHPHFDLPELKPLEHHIIKQYVAQHLISKCFSAYLNKKKLNDVESLLSIFNKKYVFMETLTEEEQKLFSEFKISSEELKEFVSNMSRQFGERYIFLPIRLSVDRFFSAEAYTRYLASDPWETFPEHLLLIAKGRIRQQKPETEEVKSKMDKPKKEKSGKDPKDERDDTDDKDDKDDKDDNEDDDIVMQSTILFLMQSGKKRKRDQEPKDKNHDRDNSPKRSCVR